MPNFLLLKYELKQELSKNTPRFFTHSPTIIIFVKKCILFHNFFYGEYFNQKVSALLYLFIKTNIKDNKTYLLFTTRRVINNKIIFVSG